jgi:hypothetical protein
MGSDQLLERPPVHDIIKLVDSGWRRDQNNSAALHSVSKLAPPAFDERTD